MNWLSPHWRRAIPCTELRALLLIPVGRGSTGQGFVGLELSGAARPAEEKQSPHSLFPAHTASQDNATWKMQGKKPSRQESSTELWSHRGLCESPHRHWEPQQHVVLVGWQPQQLGDPGESFRRRVPVQRLLLRPERARKRIILCGWTASVSELPEYLIKHWSLSIWGKYKSKLQPLPVKWRNLQILVPIQVRLNCSFLSADTFAYIQEISFFLQFHSVLFWSKDRPIPGKANTASQHCWCWCSASQTEHLEPQQAEVPPNTELDAPHSHHSHHSGMSCSHSFFN